MSNGDHLSSSTMASPDNSSPLHWRNVFRLGPARDDQFIALRTGIGVFVPLVTLVAMDRLDLAPFAIFGAFTGVYGRIPNHRDRLACQVRSGILFAIVILLAWLASVHVVEHGTMQGVWTAVVLTTLVAWGSAIVAGLWRLRPAGSLFHIFAFGAISQNPSQPPLWEGMLVAVLVIALSVGIGITGWLFPSRRTPWSNRQQPMTSEEKRAVWLESFGYLVAAGLSGVIATALMPVLNTGHSYWAMVAGVVPLVGHTTRHRVARGLHRVMGVIPGIGIMAVIIWIDPSPWVVVLLIGVMQFATELYIARNYFWGQTFVTPMALVGVGLMSGMSTQLLYDRVVETAIGAAIGVAVVITMTLLSIHRRRHRLRPENKPSAH